MSTISKFGPHLRELRLHLCQKGEGSKGVREFIEKFYVPIKIENPGFPILIRECSGVQPRLWARFEKGRERKVSLNNLKSNEVMDQLTKLIK